MPTYSYHCDKCYSDFELFCYIKDYVEHPECPACKCSKTHRRYTEDVLTQNASVKKSDSELKTIGDLALRNTEKMSNDQKLDLYHKHNSYKEDQTNYKELPKGMSRVKRPPKPIWTESGNAKQRRKKGK